MQPETLWRSNLCKNCGAEFGAKRSLTFYCSATCRAKGAMIARHLRETAKASQLPKPILASR